MIIDPKKMKHVELTGEGLTVEKVVAVARFQAEVSISKEAVEKMRKSRARVEQIVESEVPTYGINTGFGDFSTISIDKGNIKNIQKNLILSHCVATGKPYEKEVVLAIMLLRANALCIGFSGIRPEVVQTLVKMINQKVIPVIPQKGSLGASGDLAPLAHMVLPLIGYGKAVYEGEELDGADAMKRAGIPLVELEAKEGLALINGTQAMTAVGTLAYYDALMAAQLADIACAMSMEALLALTNAFDERVQAV
ncbi:MAG TPA: aromatic amino acid lyase, partial [Lachnospiraceae bacterium]|nr:aromatic amino acid lyase [Lachnospiraceae bacterium]